MEDFDFLQIIQDNYRNYGKSVANCECGYEITTKACNQCGMMTMEPELQIFYSDTNIMKKKLYTNHQA